ncbi:MAG: hypothetical protein ABIL74_08215 [candidate division WOR-3 bacterium]
MNKRLKRLIFIFFIFIACIKFEFESPYEDANGIYLQWLGIYPIAADKFVITDRFGYFLDIGYSASKIEKYTISIDSCHYMCRYIRNGTVNDFKVENEYGFLAIPSFGLEIINFQGETPFLYGELSLPGGAQLIEISGDYAYIIGDSTFYIIDITNKKEPKKLSEIKFAKKIQDFEIEGDFAFILLEAILPNLAVDFLILNIGNTNSPEIITHSCKDEILPVKMFAVSDDYIYFLSEMNTLFNYKWDSEINLLVGASLSFPNAANYLFVKGKQGLLMGNGFLHLLNLTYPETPCVCETISLQGNFTYGMIDKNYIYVLSPYLNIIEIKEIPK